MTTRPRSQSPPPPFVNPSTLTSTSTSNDDQPSASKRQKVNTTKSRKKSLPYGQGMHLAPMVRIGTLPVRLLALEYGAELVWGPEIVDKAIIGSIRTVDPQSGVISFIKNNRSIFECHPLEKPRLIFQLGSADPNLAVEALKVIEQDVAGVGLNCGCPKSFSLQGGMGAALLKDPERLCSILKALVNATDLPIDAKIRLLPLPAPTESSAPSTSPSNPTPSATTSPATTTSDPTKSIEPSDSTPSTSSTPPSSGSLIPPTLLVAPTSTPPPSEPTLPLVSQILSTGIANLTVHCRTQTMRSSEPALHHRMLQISQLSQQQMVPIVVNGDSNGWENFERLTRDTGTKSVMIARAAEANVSCFRKEGVLDPIKEVIPRLIKIAVATNNHFSNTKYLLNAMNLHISPTPPNRELNRDTKLKMNKAKNYEDMGLIFGFEKEDIESFRKVGREGKLEGLVPVWTERRKEIVEVVDRED